MIGANREGGARDLKTFIVSTHPSICGNRSERAANGDSYLLDTVSAY